MDTKLCKVCSTQFKPRSKTSIYCSRVCSGVGRRSTETRKCEACGINFPVGGGSSRGRASRQRRFCSHKCAASLQRKKPRVCKGCGIEFTRNNQNQPKYCSRACYDSNGHPEKKLTTFICDRCGKSFQRWQSQRRSENKKNFCSGECRALGRVYTRGKDHPQWKGGGRWVQENGYMVREIGGKRFLEHRWVMEQSLGRPLEKHETVHHINNDRTDNRLENLQLRSGRHGTGAVSHCGDCGSTNIVFDQL